MTNFKYLKLTKTKRIRYLTNFKKKNTYLVFLHGFKSDLEGQKPKTFLRFAKKNGAICIGFTGMHGGYFPKLCDICCAVPSNDMLIIESTHVILCHCIVDAIRNLGKPLFQYE